MPTLIHDFSETAPVRPSVPGKIDVYFAKNLVVLAFLEQAFRIFDITVKCEMDCAQYQPAKKQYCMAKKLARYVHNHISRHKAHIRLDGGEFYQITRAFSSFISA